MLKKLLIATFIFFPLTTNAATLYLDPSTGTYGAGDTFGVNVRLNNDKGECINAAQVDINFPKNILSLEDFGTGDSFLTLWITKPDKSQMGKINQDGLISFSGGIPGGYCGKVPGDPGESNILGRLFFKVPSGLKLQSDTKGLVFFASSSTILLNNGFGTAAKLTYKNGEYTITLKSQTGVNELSDLIKSDKTPPDPFVVELNRDTKIFNDAYFIIFTTTDKQTGVDHYEVLETKVADLAQEAEGQSWLDRLFGKKIVEQWVRATPPYMLKDQTLQSRIKVKAIDKAGNERVVEFTPAQARQPFKAAGRRYGNAEIYAAIFLVLILVLILAFIKRSRKKK